MNRSTHLALAALVLGGSSFAQQNATNELEAATSVSFDGIYHAASGTWTYGTHITGPPTDDVIFNNTAPSGFFDGGMSGGNTYSDEGRVPSLTSAAPVGTQGSYTLTGMELGYCTRALEVAGSGPGAHIQVGLIEKFAAGCASMLESVPRTVVLDITGAPASVAAGTLSCHTIFIDLTGFGLCLAGDGEGGFDGGDLFGYTLRFLDEVNGSAGALIAGDPNVVSDDTVFTTGGLGAGTGLDVQDLYFREADGASSSGCFFFGGYPANPFASHHFKLFGLADGLDCANCPNDDRYELPGVGDTCSSAISLNGPGLVENLTANGPDLDYYRVNVPDGATIDVTSLFQHAQGDLDLRLYNADCTILLDSSGSVSDNEDVHWLNNSGVDADVTIDVFAWPHGSSSDCADYALDVAISTGPPCGADDAFEDNDSCGTAASVSTGLTTDLQAVNGDLDYYTISVAPGEILTAVALFSDAQADLDMTLYNSDCTVQLDSSGSVSDNEDVTWTNTTGVAADVVFRVFVFPAGTGTGCGNYELDVSLVPDPCLTTPDDGFEENDDCASAVPAGSGGTNLFVSDTDSDFYDVVVPAFSTGYMTILFTHADGDLDLYLYDACGGTQLDVGFSASDNEEVSYVNNTASPVLLKLEVDFFLTGCNTYDMVISSQPGQPGTRYCQADANGSGFPAHISATGSASVSANDLVLVAAPVDGAQFGVFFHGPGQDFAPFAGTSHVRCVANPVVRSSVQLANVSGVLSLALDNNSPAGAGITLGATRYFQAWYRDPATAASFNLSDGYCVTFTQ